tara:strand:+ start:41361 stop:41951 length:591 start_codon:yes stop_codon:yes gene_type:complete
MSQINKIVGNTDIYLLDQILKGRYQKTDVILDAGSGSGRNLHWFYNNGFTVYGIDKDKNNIKDLKNTYSSQKANFYTSIVEDLNFKDHFFNHIICSAVLHFACNTVHFNTMFSELFRVLKPKGTIFIRVASNMGIEDKIVSVSEGVFNLPDGTTRFLLTRSLLKSLQEQHKFSFLESLKTVNVNDQRCMTTLVLQK